MTLDVVYRPAAEDDLDGIYDFIARDSPERSHAFVHRIRQRCSGLGDFPEIGRARDDLGRSLRSVPFEKRAMIIFRVTTVVEIVRIFYGGRDYEAALQDADPNADA